MNTRIGVSSCVHTSNIEVKGGLFESSLHLTRAKRSEISSFSGRRAFTFLLSKSCKIFHALDLADNLLDVVDGFLFGTGNRLCAVRIVRVTRSSVLL